MLYPIKQKPPVADIGALPQDLAYRRRVERRIQDLLVAGAHTLYDVCRGAEGLFPADAIRVVREVDPGARLMPAAVPPSVDPPGAELHAAEFEWYFTERCRADFLELMGRRRLLLMGAPTLAAALSRESADADLVDRSPFLAGRFPSFRLRWRRHDLRAPLGLLRSHREVFFDAPWHEDHMSRWLWQASLAVARGGTIVFVLYPELTRARAVDERMRLLFLAERIGRVELLPGCVEYETPRFEREALNAAGAPVESAWRRGDCVVVHNVRESLPAPPVPAEEDWSTLLRGREVIKLRRGLKGPPSLNGGVPLTSVSRRTTLQGQFDLLTSRQLGVRALARR